MSDLSCRFPGCTESFNNRMSRLRHEKKCHETSELEANKPVSVSKGRFGCRAPGCAEIFNYRGTRISHEKKFHEPSEIEEKKPVCGGRLCGICRERVKDLTSLCSHVKRSHGIQCGIITNEFESEREFYLWKLEIQQTSGVEFFTAISDKRQRTKVFLCHRTGTYDPIGGKSVNGRAPREIPTIKVGFDCTAFILLKEEDGKFVATACLDHYGHCIDPKLLHLDSSTQAKIVQMLKEDRRPA